MTSKKQTPRTFDTDLLKAFEQSQDRVKKLQAEAEKYKQLAEGLREAIQEAEELCLEPIDSDNMFDARMILERARASYDAATKADT